MAYGNGHQSPECQVTGEGKMPWTKSQVRYLLSKSSPLSDSEKTNMKHELHENPEMGHKPKGSRKETGLQADAEAVGRAHSDGEV